MGGVDLEMTHMPQERRKGLGDEWIANRREGLRRMSFGALIRLCQFLQHLQCVGMRDPTGGLEGRAGRWLTFASCLLSRPQKFMNDSPYCQADSLLAWGPGLGEAAAAPSFTSHTSHAGARMRIHTRAHAQAWLQWVHSSTDQWCANCRQVCTPLVCGEQG